jgi:hypothetical protein
MRRLGTLCGAAVSLVAASAGAQAIRPNQGFLANDLGPSDDDSTGAVPLGFQVTYFGANYTHVYVNNNGYIAFDEAVTTLFSATRMDQRLLAVFFADVDTRADAGTGTMHYGTDSLAGRLAFGATWSGVGYYERHTDKVDAFQIVLIERKDTGPGHFDVECNYGSIAWESGDRSDGSVDGVGGWPSAIAGYSDGVNPTFLPGSGVPGTFLDSNLMTGLIHGQNQSGVLGRYVFEFRQDPILAPATPASSDAGALDATVDAAMPTEPITPSTSGCACEVTSTRTNAGRSSLALRLLTCGVIGLLLRRRQAPQTAPRPRSGWASGSSRRCTVHCARCEPSPNGGTHGGCAATRACALPPRRCPRSPPRQCA